MFRAFDSILGLTFLHDTQGELLTHMNSPRIVAWRASVAKRKEEQARNEAAHGLKQITAAQYKRIRRNIKRRQAA